MFMLCKLDIMWWECHLNNETNVKQAQIEENSIKYLSGIP